MGGSLALNGEIVESLTVFDEMILYYPNDVDGLSKRAEVLSMLNRQKEALQIYKKLFELGSDSVILRIHAGSIYFIEKEFQAALNEFELALKIIQSDNDIKYSKNNKKGNDNENRDKNDQNDNNIHQKNDNLLLNNEDKKDKVLMNYEDKVTYILILHRIGKCYKESSDPRSLEYLNRALDLDPESKEILMDIAAVLMELGKEN